ncbi:UPF0149 family protein [Motiliproteus sediminis]|uniref:UPF0149 family protein n=1 Tax=Motiliproteus sediminis TaxID=1468178 RepID=UPI001AEFD5DC|nr:UPF0149 family protein [Motiliproteus sediminis]
MSEESVKPALPSFDALADLFVAQGALVSPSEVQGYLVGVLAAGQRLAAARWLEVAAEQLGVDELIVDGLPETLEQLRSVTQTQLETQGFELQLLMPDDEADVSQRADSLGVWCHGFLAGYALAGGSMSANLGEDARDALEDFAQIAQIAVDPDDSDSEGDFEEVYEYVRMAALLLFSECNRAGPEECAPPGTSLH